ncbi:hypothetical protein RI367_007009 [Sorochytrium milnesiophthora]
MDALATTTSVWNAQSVLTALGVLALSTATVAAFKAATAQSSERWDSTPPTVPAKSSFLGSTLLVRSNPLSYLRETVARYGPTFRMRYFGDDVVVVSDVNAVKRVLEDKNLSFLRAMYDLFPLVASMDADQESHIFEYHALAMLVKQYVTPNLKRFTPVAVHEFEAASEVWLQKLRKETGAAADASVVVDKPFDMLMDMVARGSISVFVGSELRDDPILLNMAKTLTIDLSASLRKTGFLLFFPRVNRLLHRLMFTVYSPLNRHLRQIAQAIDPMVREHLRHKANAGDVKQEHDSVFGYMLDQYPHVTDASPEHEKRELVRVLAAQLRSLMFASIHTTTTNANLVLYYLVQHAPQCMAEILDEQLEVLGGDSTITFESLKHMKKLDSFIREVFRYSVVGIILCHRSLADDGQYELPDGQTVPSNKHIYLNATAIHRSEDLQGPEPDKFDPWRFLHNGRQAIKAGPDYLHFGHGPHACPGRFFAIQEIKAVISMLITKYNISTDKDIDLGPHPDPWTPSGPLRFEPRV